MAVKSILLFGLNRSGTNFLQEMLQKHFDVEFLNSDQRDHPLHKHFRLYDNKALIGRPNFRNNLSFKTFKEFESTAIIGDPVDAYLVISKDPYSWNLSYKSWGIKNNWDKSPHPYILEYNEFYKKWLQFSRESKQIVLLRYIDILKDPAQSMERIKTIFDLDPISAIIPEKRIKKVPTSHRFTKKRLNYYLNDDYLKDYSKKELTELNTYLDHKLVEELGYSSFF